MITFLRAQRTRIFWVAIILVILGLGLNAWYKSIYSDPRRVFDAMLENALRTSSVTKQVIQEDETQALNQQVRLELGENHLAQGLTNLSQTGLASATVVTESLGTPTVDYVRYRSIDTDQKNEAGDALDFSEVIGVWGKTESTGSTSGELYNETVLGVIPFGNLSAADRKEILQLARELDVYRVEYANVKRGEVGGRPAYEYTVKVLPEAYVTLLKAFAKKAGLSQLENINPANYANADSIEFTVAVDIRTRRLANISYASGRKEGYISYGNDVDVTVPKETVSIEELQTRLQSVE